MHVQNKKHGNFVSISRLTGKCAAQKIKNFCSAFVAPCGEVTKAVARLLRLLWRGYQICGEITCGEVTLWQGYSQVTVQYFVGISNISTTFWFQ